MKQRQRTPLTAVHRPLDRRSFLKGMIAAGAAAAVLPSSVFTVRGQTVRRAPPGTRVNLACVGIGNRGREVTNIFHATGMANIVALCDTDMGARHTGEILGKFPGVPRFQDFRKMFDKMGAQIDAVVVNTPDHSHFPIAMLAMSLGRHVFVEKPMAHSFRQTTLMMAAEEKYRVACQMGNQGHSGANYFQFKAWTEAGIIRNVTRITAFMNNPRRWHGMTVHGFLRGEEVPASLDYETWVATANKVPYNSRYMNGEWRSWFNFGNGALGDWGAHIFDTAHRFLNLGLPTVIDPVKGEGWSPFIFPQASTIRFHFPARGSQPPCVLTWYDGQQNLPALPDYMGEPVLDPDIPPPSRSVTGATRLPPGKIIHGEGLTFQGGSHSSTLRIIPESRAREMAAQLPEVPASPSDHFRNFLLACMGQERCRSNFAVAGPLCQMTDLGVIAQRVNARLEFDPAAGRVTNHRLANELLAGPPPRPEWEQFYKL